MFWTFAQNMQTILMISPLIHIQEKNNNSELGFLIPKVLSFYIIGKTRKEKYMPRIDYSTLWIEV